jgi:hypothetical protein
MPCCWRTARRSRPRSGRWGRWASYARAYARLPRYSAGAKPIARDIVARGETLQPEVAGLHVSHDLAPRSIWDRWTPRVSETFEAVVTAMACETITEFAASGGGYGDATTGMGGRLGCVSGGLDMLVVSIVRTIPSSNDDEDGWEAGGGLVVIKLQLNAKPTVVRFLIQNDASALSSPVVSRVAKGLSCRTPEEAEELALRIMGDSRKPDELVVKHHGRLVQAVVPDLTGAARVYLYKVWEASPAIKSASHQAAGGGPIPERAFINDKRAYYVEGRCSLVSCMWTTITLMMMTDHTGAIRHTHTGADLYCSPLLHYLLVPR